MTELAERPSQKERGRYVNKYLGEEITPILKD